MKPKLNIDAIYQDKMIVPEVFQRGPGHYSIIFDSGTRIDFYPKNRRWHDVYAGNYARGSYDSLPEFLEEMYQKHQIEK